MIQKKRRIFFGSRTQKCYLPARAIVLSIRHLLLECPSIRFRYHLRFEKYRLSISLGITLEWMEEKEKNRIIALRYFLHDIGISFSLQISDDQDDRMLESHKFSLYFFSWEIRIDLSEEYFSIGKSGKMRTFSNPRSQCIEKVSFCWFSWFGLEVEIFLLDRREEYDFWMEWRFAIFCVEPHISRSFFPCDITRIIPGYIGSDSSYLHCPSSQLARASITVNMSLDVRTKVYEWLHN